MLMNKRISWVRFLSAGFFAASVAMPITGHTQAYLLPAFKECLAAAERGGEGAPTRSECYQRHQEAQSANGP